MLARHKRLRRICGAALVVLGGVLMWLAPESVAGAILLGAGFLLEAAGITVEHRNSN